MPFLIAIGTWLLKNALPWIWHSVQRFWSVFLIGAVIVIVLLKFGAFKNTIYAKGYSVGYSQALTDHPSTTVQSGGVAITNIGDKVKSAGIEIDGFGFGFWHRAK